MPDTQTRDSRSFAARLPRPDVLASVLRDDPVERLLLTARDRAIVKGGDDLMPKKSADEEEVAAMLDEATEAAQRLALDPAAKAQQEREERSISSSSSGPSRTSGAEGHGRVAAGELVRGGA